VKIKLNLVTIFNLAGAAIIIYLLVVLGQTIKHNYDLSRQIDRARQETALAADQRDALRYSIQYYQTDSFRDREARAKLGLQLPGENVVVLPPSSSAQTAPAPVTAAAAPRSNFQQWLDFLTGATN